MVTVLEWGQQKRVCQLDIYILPWYQFVNYVLYLDIILSLKDFCLVGYSLAGNLNYPRQNMSDLNLFHGQW